MSEFKDRFFLDNKTALAVAKQQNRINCTPQVTGLQICYYAGEKLENTPLNCIHVPLEEVYSYFTTTTNRLPKIIDFTNQPFSDKEQKKFRTEFTDILNLAIIARAKLEKKIKNKIKKFKPDFSKKPWKIFLPACRETVVMQHISKNIAAKLESMGFNVFFHIQKNDMEHCSALSHLEDIYKFKPHITININHFNNTFLHEDIFNIVWFQDDMASLFEKETMVNRKRDFVFHLTQGLKQSLKDNLNLKTKYQPFCINNEVFKKRNKIKRNNKIVFIGSSYCLRVQRISEKIGEVKTTDIVKDMEIAFNLNNVFTKKQITAISEKHAVSYSVIEHLSGYVIRDTFILKICELNIDYDIEIYGWGWDKYKSLKPYYQGVLSYGKDISKVYNSAKYTVVTGGYLLQQRALEAMASGCTPLFHTSLYDIDEDIKPSLRKEFITFKTLQEFEKLLTSNITQNNDKKVVNYFNYKRFAKRIIKIVNNKILATENLKLNEK